MGILLAIIALFSWGIGDFLIQRSARRMGDWASLFFITFFGAIVLLPFAWSHIPEIFGNQKTLLLLSVGGLAMFVASIIDFEALKRGKISVIETTYALEIPIAGFLAGSLLAERLSPIQTVLILVIVVGITLTSAKDLKHLRTIRWEQGAFLAIAATIGMGVVNFLVAWGGRETNAIVVNWFICTVVAMICLTKILLSRGWSTIVKDWREQKELIIFVSAFDNLAWVAFAGSSLFLPVAVATAISESYIVVAAILGVVYNRERNDAHQNIGLALTVLAASALAFFS